MKIELSFSEKIRILRAYYQRVGTTIEEQFGVLPKTIVEYVNGRVPGLKQRKHLMRVTEGFLVETDFINSVPMKSPKQKFRKPGVKTGFNVKQIRGGNALYRPDVLPAIARKAARLKAEARSRKVKLHELWGTSRQAAYMFLKGLDVPCDNRIAHIVENSWGILKMEDFLGDCVEENQGKLHDIANQIADIQEIHEKQVSDVDSEDFF